MQPSPPAPAPVPPADPVTVRIEGIEVVQAVQSLAHSVPLVAGKATVVRIYLSAAGVDRPVVVGGEVELHAGGDGPARYLPALDTVRLDPAQPRSLAECRGDVEHSLNFLLSDADVVAGTLRIDVGTLVDAMAGRSLTIVDAPGVRHSLTVRFVEVPPLRVRLIGMRHTAADGTAHSPRAIDFEFLVSWLRRAYPVPRVEHTQIVTDLDPGITLTAEGACGRVNAVLAQLRTFDVATGTDPRTHYLAVVSDAGGTVFMRGCASGRPLLPDPSVVASSPTGRPENPGFTWDDDESYGDWYGGHELAHTFGRSHPGFPVGKQDRTDTAYPFGDGLLSDGDTFVGFDIGDPAWKLPMRALPGQRWHDVMTYSPRQWLSSYTYGALLTRLIEEDTVPGAPIAPGPQDAGARAGAPAPGRVLNIVARVDLTAGTAEILTVSPLPTAPERPASDPDAPQVLLRLIDASGAVEEHQLAVRLDSCVGGDGETNTGLVDAVVEARPGLAAVELAWDGRSRARRELSRSTPSTPALEVAPPPAGRADADAGAGPDDHRRTVSWSGHAPGIRYNVQVSDDDGETWQTIAVNRTEPQVELDRNQFSSDRLKVRVYATDGVDVHRSTLDVDMGG